MLLERILELEISQPQIKTNGIAFAASSSDQSMPLAQSENSALPRSLPDARARTSFVANLPRTVAEDEAGENDTDSALSSQHVGPASRKRSDDERKEQLDEDSHRQTKKARHTPNKGKGAETSGSPVPQNAVASSSSDNRQSPDLHPHRTSLTSHQTTSQTPLLTEPSTLIAGDTSKQAPQSRSGKTTPAVRRSSRPRPANSVVNYSESSDPTSTPTTRSTKSRAPASRKQSIASGSASHTASRSVSATVAQVDPKIDPSLSPVMPTASASSTTKSSSVTPSPGPDARSTSSSTSGFVFGNGAGPSTASGASTSSTPNLAAPVTPTTGINPYSLYFQPGPGNTHTPAYPHPFANPYFYLTGAMSGVYPPNPVPYVPPAPQRPPAETPRPAKPKRLKAHTVTSKSFSIPLVPRDKGGKPMLPLNVGIMTVISLGDVCMREHFHTERYIFPVGYEVTRFAAFQLRMKMY